MNSYWPWGEENVCVIGEIILWITSSPYSGLLTHNNKAGDAIGKDILHLEQLWPRNTNRNMENPGTEEHKNAFINEKKKKYKY